MPGLFPLAGIFGVIVHQNAVLADVVNLAATSHDTDEPLGGHLGDEPGQPVQLAGLAVLVGGLGEDVHQSTGGDLLAEGLDVLGERLQLSHALAAEGHALVGGVGFVEVGEDSVHVPVVSSHCVCSSLNCLALYYIKKGDLSTKNPGKIQFSVLHKQNSKIKHSLVQIVKCAKIPVSSRKIVTLY